MTRTLRELFLAFSKEDAMKTYHPEPLCYLGAGRYLIGVGNAPGSRGWGCRGRGLDDHSTGSHSRGYEVSRG